MFITVALGIANTARAIAKKKLHEMFCSDVLVQTKKYC